MTVICFDTHLLIWGIRGYAEPTQSHMIGRTRRYIQHLDSQREQIMVPTPALAEYLVGVPPQDRERHRRALERHFIFPAFDFPSAQLAAELQQNRELLKEVRRESNTPRQCLKTDVMIIAVAIAHGANKIITHEFKSFKKLAGGMIEVEDIPDISEQEVLFE